MIVALLLRLFLADRQETALLILSPQFRESIYASERNVLAEARAVAAIPGDVACFVKLVCRQAPQTQERGLRRDRAADRLPGRE
jgi:hypothetical protein